MSRPSHRAGLTPKRALLGSCVLALFGCRDAAPTDGHESPAVALAAEELTVDALAAPRDDNPLIAGEDVRIGVRIRGGTPPYSGRVTAERQGRPLGQDMPAPVDARLALDPDAAGSGAVEVATRATLDARAPSGLYRLRASIADARGRTATVYSSDFRLIGDDAERLPPPAPGDVAGPEVRVVDVAARARATFVRGESVVVHVSLPGETRATFEVRAPDGRILARSTLALPDHGPAAHSLRVPLDIPRLAMAGSHAISARGLGGAVAGGVIEVAGPRFPPVSGLVIDAMHVYGGRDLRAPRAGVVRRGEDLRVETRVGGARAHVVVTLRLSGHLGVADERELARADIGDARPGARVYLSGAWRVPERILPGRYQLQLEVMEGDHVSLRSRELLIR